MKHLRYIVSFVLCTLSLCTWSQDFARMGERSIMGTARYVGMSGAMSAIGADPSATLDNVAGLGMYRRAEILVSFDYMADRAWQVGVPDTKGRARLFMAPQAALVLSFPTNKVSGIQYHNVQISYQRIHAYNRALSAKAENSPSLGALLADKKVELRCSDGSTVLPYCSDRLNTAEQMDLVESGYVNEYAFDWAMNISNRWYVGAGLRINSFSMSSEGKYQEWFTMAIGERIRFFRILRGGIRRLQRVCLGIPPFIVRALYRVGVRRREIHGLRRLGPLSDATVRRLYAIAA